MTDFDLPDLPSDEELGITDDDKEKYGDDLPDDGPELTDEEMAALLGGTAPKAGPSGSGSSRSDKEAAKEKAVREKQREKEAKRRAKAEKQKRKQEKKAANEAAKSQAPTSADGGDGESGGASGSGDAGGGSPGGPRALAPMPGWRGPVTLLILIALAFVSSSRTGQVDPVPANAEESDFSSARAMSTLVDLAREAHPTGSREHTRVRDMLLERLGQLGLEPEVQTATTLLERSGSVSGDPAVARAATVRNIVARIPGSNPTGAVLVTAHYDSRQIAVGAGDDGSGVATILEAVRALRAGPTLRNDVIVLLTDAEELGLLGARAFVDRHRWMPDVDLVLSFEMRGGAGPSIMFETNERNGWVVRALQRFDPHPFANSMSYEVYERMPRDTDFTPFKEAGVQGLNFAAIDNAHVYHQVYDTPANVSPSTLQHHGIHALEGLRYLGNADLTSVNDSNVVFFSVPGLGLVVYDTFWVLAISLLLLGAFALLFMAARRGGARSARIAAAAALSVAVGVAAYMLGTLTFGWLTALHPEYGALHGSAFHGEGWYVLGIVFATFLLVVGASTLSRRWISPSELAVGALVLPLVAAVGSGFAAPLAAMNLQWPVAAAILATTVMALLRARGSGLVGWVVFVALAVPVFLLLQPVLELLWLAMSLELAGGLAVIAAAGFFLCLPLLHSLEAPNRWWAPLTFAIAAVGCVGTGILTRGPSADAPAPSTLVYAYEHGADSALWATAPTEGLPGVSASSPSPGTAWVLERVGSGFDATARLEAFGYREDPVPVAPARVLLVEPPSIEVVTDTLLGDARRAVVHVRSRLGAEMLGFELAGQTRLTSVNGQVVSNVDDLRWIDHWGVPDSAVVLELTLPPGAPMELFVVEHLLRPEELLGQDAFRRPPELAPNVNWLSDRAMFRYSFGDPIEAVAPGPDQGVPDELIEIRQDTLPAPPDTSGFVADTLPAPPDTGSVPAIGSVPDGSAAATDTATAAGPARPGHAGAR